MTKTRCKIGPDNFLRRGHGLRTIQKIRSRPTPVAGGRREGMIMRVCRREVSCGRGWGVSLRSTTCKRMVTVPGGELRCTGNLCSERERGRERAPLSSRSQRAAADHKPPAKHRWAFFLEKNRTRTARILHAFPSWCDIFAATRVVSSIYNLIAKSVCSLLLSIATW